jgi:hypothetical protein
VTQFAARFRAVAVPRLLEAFGERGDDGEFAELLYSVPGVLPGVEPLKFTGIVSPIRFQDVVDPNEGFSRMETRTWRVERAQADAAGVTGYQHGATFEDSAGKWAIDDATTVWDANFVTFGMSRKPLVRRPGDKRAAV